MTITTYADFKTQYKGRKDIFLTRNDSTFYHGGINGAYATSFKLISGGNISASNSLIAFDNTHASAINKDTPLHQTNRNFIIESLFAVNPPSRTDDTRSSFNYQWIDVLCQELGKAFNTTSPQSFTPNTLTRHTSGEGVMLFFLGVTNVTGTVGITFSYTNQNGVSGRTSKEISVIATGVNGVSGSMYPIPLQDGDTGVQSVQSVTCTSALGTAGNFGYTLIKPLSRNISSQLLGGDGYGWPMEHAIQTNLGFVEVDKNACLGLLFSKTAYPVFGHNFLKANIISE